MTTSPTPPTPQPGWNLWFRWVAVHIVGIIASAALIFLLLFIIAIWSLGAYTRPQTQMFELMMLGAAAGALIFGMIGRLQRQVLQTYIYLSGWTTASLIGGIASVLIIFVPRSVPAPFTEPVIAFGLVSVVVFFSVGFAQWLVLRQPFPQARWWIVASGASGLLPIVYPFVTGGVLVWLLRHQPSRHAWDQRR